MARILRISSCLLLLLAAPALADSPKDPGVQLAFAAAAGSPSDVDALLKAGADPNHATNASGVPALSLAAARHDGSAVDIINELLAAKASIDIEDKQGQTPLFYAAQADNIKILKLLMAGGANAYHADSKNQTARDVAFKAGHKDAVDAIDTQINAKSRDVMQQYAEHNRQMEDRNKQIADNNALFAERNKEIAERAQQLAEQSAAIEKQNAELKEKLAKAQEAQKAIDAEKAARQKAEQEKAAQQKADQQQAAEAQRKQRPKTIDVGALEGLIYDLSYHACAAEYWRFCRAVKQDTGMSREDLRNQMEAHKTLADVTAQKIRKDFGATDAYLLKVTAPSTQQIYNTLARFSSNADRKDEGIGTKKDLDTRCTDIADQWELMKAGSAPLPVEEQDAGAPKTRPANQGGRNLPVPRQSRPPRRGGLPGAAHPAPRASAPAQRQQPSLQPNGMPSNPPTQILP